MKNEYIKEAKIKEGQSDLRGAIEFYKKALEENPRDNSLQIDIGNLLATLANIESCALGKTFQWLKDNDKNIKVVAMDPSHTVLVHLKLLGRSMI